MRTYLSIEAQVQERGETLMIVKENTDEEESKLKISRKEFWQKPKEFQKIFGFKISCRKKKIYQCLNNPVDSFRFLENPFPIKLGFPEIFNFLKYLP